MTAPDDGEGAAAALADLLNERWLRHNFGPGRRSYRGLARLAGVGSSTVHAFLTGRRPQPPHWGIVHAIAAVLDIDGEELAQLQELHRRAEAAYRPAPAQDTERRVRRRTGGPVRREQLACPACGTPLEVRARVITE